MTETSENSSEPSQTAPQAKGQERLRLTSGTVLIIDQFMLANDQFFAKRSALAKEGSSEKEALRGAAEQYGGCVVDLPEGEYDVFRDPEQTLLGLSREGLVSQDSEEERAEGEGINDIISDARGNAAALHRVFVDTRCVVFVDSSVVADEELMGKYRSFRKKGDEKGARDFLREAGGAVRYGFNRYGDELGVFRIRDGEVLALWPDVLD